MSTEYIQLAPHITDKLAARINREIQKVDPESWVETSYHAVTRNPEKVLPIIKRIEAMDWKELEATDPDRLQDEQEYNPLTDPSLAGMELTIGKADE